MDTTTDTFSPSFIDAVDASPFHAAVAWYRLIDASNYVQSVQGLDSELVDAIDTLRTEVWETLCKATGFDNNDARDRYLEHAREFLKGKR